MAQEEQAAEVVQAPKSKKKIIIILLVLFVALAAGGSAALLLLGGGGKKAQGREDARAHKSETVLVAFEDKFTVNIQSGDGSSHYLQVPKLELEVANKEVADKVEAIKSKISDRISSVLRQKTMEELLEPGSDLKLKKELKDMINQTLGIGTADAARNGVHEVILPASFIVQ